MNTSIQCAVFVASAILAGAVTYPTKASAAFASVHSSTSCVIYGYEDGYPIDLEAIQRSTSGLYATRAGGAYVLCSPPDDGHTTVSSTAVTLSGYDSSTTTSPTLELCVAYWNTVGGACNAIASEPPTNTGPFTLWATGLTPWHGIGWHQLDLPFVVAAIPGSPSFPASSSAIYGATVYY